MNDRLEKKPSPDAAEPMIDARKASYALNLPYYWFVDRKLRASKRIPHYLLGGLVRFRLSELHAWSAHFANQNLPSSREDEGHD